VAAHVDVEVDPALELPIAPEELERAMLHVLAAEGVGKAELSLAVVGDAEIAQLNQEYLSHDGPTDVISFPLENPAGLLVGDIYVGGEQARRQAEEAGEELRVELLRLAIHGTLHVLGHEHPEEDEQRAASPMYLRQEALLRRFLDP
jgi:probable rRNA maturation factor